MKIVQLKAENVKRLTAVEITPDGSTVIIGGKNEAGKSSVLDAIAMALGGAKLAPAQPIRKGANEATIEVDLGDYVVTRKFKRVFKEVTQTEGLGTNPEAQQTTQVPTGEVTSTLTVSSKAKEDAPAAKFQSPQAMLDKMLGSLTFDPLTFATAHGTDQSAILRRVVKLDTSDLDQAIKDLEAKQTESSRELKNAIAGEANATHHEDAPLNKISPADVATELEKANALKDAVIIADNTVNEAVRNAEATRGHLITNQERRVELERQLAQLVEEEVGLVARERDLIERVNAARARLKEAQAAVPDIDAIRKRLLEIDTLNRKFADNEAFFAAGQRASDARRVHEAIKVNLDAARRARETRVAMAKFPVDGLAFGPNGVLYNDIPFEQASTAVKLRVSVAVGLALNPTLKVLLIREGAFLDEENLALVGQLAEEAGAQVWIERVGTAGVSVVIEDGHVRA